MPSSNEVTLKIAGLHTYNNPLSSVPEGSFLEATNIVIQRKEVAEPRRGQKQYGNTFGISTNRTKQVLTYKDVVLRHVLTNLQYDSDTKGTFTNFGNATTISEVEQGLRIKSIEANGNLYFTTVDGIKKLSAQTANDFSTISVTSAGAPKALDVTATPNFISTGFLTANSKVAYRIVWGSYDRNENLLLGAPSSRAVVFNATARSSITTLNFAIPSDVINATYFYQIYRTGVFSQTPTNIDPGEEFQLVLQDNVTAAQITAGSVTINDITPDEFRKQGEFLYTNPASGTGIVSSNDKPPFAKDITTYKGYTFYANTSTVQRLNISFLSVEGLYPTNTINFKVSNGTTTNTYLFQGSFETYLANYTGLPFASLFNAVANSPAKYFTLDSANNETSYVVWYSRNPANDIEPIISGKINIKVDISAAVTLIDAINKTSEAIYANTKDFNITRSADILSIKCSNNGFVTAISATTIAGPFFITKNNLGTGQKAATNKIFLPRIATGAVGDENGPTTAQQLEQVARSLINVLNLKDTIVSAYYLSTFDSVPGQVLLEQRSPTGPAFFLNSNFRTVYPNPDIPPANPFNPSLDPTLANVISTNEISPNRIYYSKFQQPEAVPLANFVDIGPRDRAIKRILALRDSLFVLKEEGIYRISGEVAPFQVALHDSSAQILAADSAAILNNLIYCWTTQGVVQITDSQVQIISNSIENTLLFVSSQNPVYKTASFGVSYESDRQYILWMPTTANDVVATQGLVYNSLSNKWTRRDDPVTCAVVNFGNDKLYTGAGDLNIVEEERKSLTRTDHADREYEKSIQLGGVGDTTIKLTSVTNTTIGDVLLQTQYLTGQEFNRLLRQLDLDTTVNQSNFFSTLEYKAGENLRTKIVSLAQKLDVDTGLVFNNYEALIGSYTNTITTTTLGPTMTITLLTPNFFKIGRYVTILGSNSVPTIDGTHRVNANPAANTIQITKTVTTGSTTGTISTADQDFKDIQGCFNLLVNQLNLDDGAFFSTYELSSGTVEFEQQVLSVDVINNSVTVPSKQLLLFGPITLFKAIKTRITWNQQTFGDPTTEKQVRECKILFENTNFTKMFLKFATDRSPNFQGNEYNGLGLGDFGQFNFGTVNFGGVAAPLPLRDYVPRDKQRCTFIFVRIEHGSAREKWSLFGVSLNARPYNIRITK